MKKNLFVAGLAVALFLSAAAQITQKDEPPKPPAPPKAPIGKMKEVPPPPPPPPPSEPPPPPPPPPPVPAEEMQLPDDYEAFLKKNASVETLNWNRNNVLTITLKSGQKERYNLNDEKSKKAAIEKYGELPAAPPPPPPPPPAPEPPIRKSERNLS